jgi:PAS domain S-box-containing protein
MRLTIANKLFASGIVVLSLIMLMIIASQVVVYFFKNNSTNLVVEYNELDAIEEFKFSLSSLLISTSNYATTGNKSNSDYFDILVYQTEEKLKHCEEVITYRHSRILLKDFENIISNVDRLAKEMFLLDIEKDKKEINRLLKLISVEVEGGIQSVNSLLNETKGEIDEYLAINDTVIKHSTITFLALGLIVALIIIIGGWLFIKSLTRPINELVRTTRKIHGGNRDVKVNIKSSDEFQTLAESFNSMMTSLEETTVSRNYLNNILKNMFDALIVTSGLKIKSVNRAAQQLLNYEEDELQGKDIGILFSNGKESMSINELELNGLDNVKLFIDSQQYLVTKSGLKIPALLSSAIMTDHEFKSEGLVIVGHDLTDKTAIEKKLEQARKERLIAINEAQEEERMRIATDLHDGLGQVLTAISYAVQELAPTDKYKNSQANEPVLKIQEQIDKAIRETKNLAHNLIPIVLKDFGLIVAIENLIDRANELHTTKFRFDAFDFNERIDPKREKVLYRICQESLNNIIKHAQARNAYYQIFWQDCSVVLVIEDDGIGFDVESQEYTAKSKGIGLISMRERVLAFDGNFTINSETGKGTEIIVEIPCHVI